jgi:hypothetical protein
VNLDVEYEMKLVYLEWMEIMQVFARKKMGPAQKIIVNTLEK